MSSLPGITESQGWYAIDWVQHFLVHGPGDVQGKRIELDDELASFLVRAYAVDRRGNRRVRRAFLSRAKGRNKSGFAAMVECFEALGECRFDHWAERGEVSEWGYEFEPGEPVGRPLRYVEVLNVATEEGQAGNTYDAVYYMLHPETCSPELLERFGRLDVGLTRINLPDFRGFIEPVSASNESKDGAKSTFIVADETHLWLPPAVGVFKLGRMHQTMIRNLLKRKESSGWMLETSTMYVEGEGSVAEGTHRYAKSLASNGRRAAVLLFDHRQASDDFDLTVRAGRLAALRDAYGPASSWMNLQAIADYWDDPQATEEEFRRFWLNQPVAVKAERTVFDLVAWARLEDRELVPPRRVALAVHVAEYQANATIAVAGQLVDGSTAVLTTCGAVNPDLVDEGMGWVAAKVVGLVDSLEVVEVALLTGEARALEAELSFAGIEFKKLNGVDVAASCTGIQSAVTESATAVSRGLRPSLRHMGQPQLDTAVAHAKTRRMGAAATWEEGTGSALVAGAAAFHRWGVLADAPYDLLASVR